MIPRHFIDLLLTRIDIIELINSHVPLTKKSGNNYFARCPFHTEKSASFSVSANKQFYYCFGCGAHGNAIDFVMTYDHLSFREAVESLARIAGLPLPQEAQPENQIDNLQALLDTTQSSADFFYQTLRQDKRAIQYLKNRGIDGNIAKQFCLGYAPSAWSALTDALAKNDKAKNLLLAAGLIIKKSDGHCYDRFRDRIMFPIHDYRGRVIGFGGRIIDEGEPKYLNSPETKLFQKNQSLYGLYQTLQQHRQLNKILIVEGYMDVIALFQFGITYAVATLGTATSEAHLRRLCRYTNEIIFCFDGDVAGENAAWRALQIALPIMHDELQIRFLFLPDGEDPDSLIRKVGKENFEALIIEAQPLSNFFFEKLLRTCNLETLEGRANFAALALPFLMQIPDGIFKNFMLEELSRRARMKLSDIKNPLKNVASTENETSVEKDLLQKLPQGLRLVFALLVQYPRLALLITDPLPELKLQGSKFLSQLIEIIKNRPNISTARLVEHWRGQKEETFLAQLAHFPHMLGETGIENEFLGALRQVLTLGFDEEINRLLTKAANQGLLEGEKIELSHWIGKKKALQALYR